LRAGDYPQPFLIQIDMIKFIELIPGLEVSHRNLSVAWRDSLVYDKGFKTPGKTSILYGRLYNYPDALEITNKLKLKLPTVRQAEELGKRFNEFRKFILDTASMVRLTSKVSFDSFFAGFADEHNNCFALNEGGFYWTDDPDVQLALYPDGSYELLECNIDMKMSIRVVREL
jgi:hypothetical protein